MYVSDRRICLLYLLRVRSTNKFGKMTAIGLSVRLGWGCGQRWVKSDLESCTVSTVGPVLVKQSSSPTSSPSSSSSPSMKCWHHFQNIESPRKPPPSRSGRIAGPRQPLDNRHSCSTFHWRGDVAFETASVNLGWKSLWDDGNISTESFQRQYTKTITMSKQRHVKSSKRCFVADKRTGVRQLMRSLRGTHIMRPLPARCTAMHGANRVTGSYRATRM